MTPTVVAAIPADVDVAIVRQGRRLSDVITVARTRSVALWLFGMFLDERDKPSMSRIMLALITIVGVRLFEHEIDLTLTQPPISNAAWAAWWAAEGALSLAVFGPRIASYFGPGAAGAASASSIGASVRDAISHIPGINAPATTAARVDVGPVQPIDAPLAAAPKRESERGPD